ncbi:MAG: hypothetical protein KDB21_08920 [Acidimicrobiales bacterium]|nr:hypothetical protein [Acidimicrobiales bacterium]
MSTHTTTTAPQPTRTSTVEVVDAVIEEGLAQLSGQVIVSRSRAVDLLLDVYTATSSPVVRDVVAELLDDIRHVNAVEAEVLRDRLLLVQVAAAVEDL